ncbi:DUF805 domain-containing protein [Veillonella sp.]|uniref:DUF805 domain-containing protein n=1 Tax=Veillonella sp. TaxID=1926307 RepID=UPI0025ED582D|nr:DUF805 domain-containing protein [Veillonella sp.]
MFCSLCGEPIEEGTRFCPHCGQENILTSVPVLANRVGSLDLIDNFKLCMTKKYWSVQGRATRGEYWKFQLLLVALWVLIVGPCLFAVIMLGNAVSSDLSIGLFFLLLVVLFIAFIPPNISCEIRRFHDAGFSGWWFLLHLIPGGSMVCFIFTLLPSQLGPNEYGPLPDYSNYSERYAMKAISGDDHVL